MTDQNETTATADQGDEFQNAAPTLAATELSSPLPPAALPLSPATDGEVDGRDPANGRFVTGNRAGRGNPLARRANQLRVALYRECSGDDLAAVIRRLIDEAKGGDVAAAKVLLERLLGPPIALDVATRIERLEILLQERLP